MDLSSIITSVPNPSESNDPHDLRSEVADSENHQESLHKTDAQAAQATASAGGAVNREEETPFADNNNASANVDGSPASDTGTGAIAAPTAIATSPGGIPASSHDGHDETFPTPPPTGSLNVTSPSPQRSRVRSRARRGGFFRSLLCCFAGSPAETNGPPLEPETNGDLTSSRLLGPPRITDRDKKCFIIDLDETLVHSSFKPVENPDFIVPVEIDGTTHQVYVLKRPYVDEFLKRMGQLYECVLFTASLAKYADPVANLLDKWNVFRFRLFREACVFHRGNYVKDLSRLNRDLHKVVILDNSPSSYMFHTDNAVQVISWFDDREDRALLDLIPFFEALARADSVITFLKHNTPPGLPAFAALSYGGQSLTEA